MPICLILQFLLWNVNRVLKKKQWFCFKAEEGLCTFVVNIQLLRGTHRENAILNPPRDRYLILACGFAAECLSIFYI